MLAIVVYLVVMITLKFIYYEKATKFCEIFPLLLTTTLKLGEDFAKFCGLLRIYELYKN